MPTSTRSAATAGPLDDWVLLFARIAIAPLFLYSGVGKVLAFAATASRLSRRSGRAGRRARRWRDCG